LDPAGMLADAAAAAVADEARHERLERRLGEREEVRREAGLALLSEQLAEQVSQRSLQVGERYAAVDGEAFDLVEDREVRRIRGVAPVAAAEGDHVDGRRLGLHHMDLAGR